MLNLLKTIVTKLGGVDTAQATHIDTFTEEKINGIPGEKMAQSNTGGGIWIEFQELAGYIYLNVNIVNEKKMNNFNGCSLTFYNEQDEIIKLESDTKEIESNFSNVSNRWITEVSFDVTDYNLDFLEHKTANTVKLEYKKTMEIFDLIK